MADGKDLYKGQEVRVKADFLGKVGTKYHGYVDIVIPGSGAIHTFPTAYVTPTEPPHWPPSPGSIWHVANNNGTVGYVAIGRPGQPGTYMLIVDEAQHPNCRKTYGLHSAFGMEEFKDSNPVRVRI